jgi:hypothetical protein
MLLYEALKKRKPSLIFNFYEFYLIKRYMILAPATMAAESDPKVAASKCLQEVELDPESYRIGHTKASSVCENYTYFPLEFRILI